jgi:peptidoglycan L-alanyl-D-glutamate endopeptidase CwlK
MIDSRKLEDLVPDIAAKANALIVHCKKVGITLLVTSTYRDYERQTALYAQGRTQPGEIVTRAKAGYSAHNFRRAFDVVPLDSSGNPWWKAPEAIWQSMGEIGKLCGLEWGGDWSGFKDKPHFQDLGGNTLAQLRASHRESTKNDAGRR